LRDNVREGRRSLVRARTWRAGRQDADGGKDAPVPCTLHVAWDDRLTRYDFGPSHPLAPVRVELTIELARDFGVLNAAGVTMAVPEPATMAELELVHDPAYIGAVQRAGSGAESDPRELLRYGLGTPDDPVFPGMHDASALVAGATLAAARAMWSGAAGHGANIAGGLHHAMAGHASGFCVYNDPAIAIAWLLGQGAERIGYVDIDVHHGDGVQAAFWADPRVLTILLRAFRPQVLVSQHGCDTHFTDPLANLALTIDAQRAAHAAIHQLAHETAGGRWLLTGGGGYSLVDVVPRTWTHLLAEAAGRPIDPQAPTPADWRDYVRRRTGRAAPELMTDGQPGQFSPFESGYDPADPVDRAIIATRNAVFPLHGLLPLP
jgi:acetoin utilization protein AcuC